MKKYYTKNGKVRPITKRKPRIGTRQKGTIHLTPKSMFYPASGKYSRIVKMDNPDNAQKSVNKLSLIYTRPAQTQETKLHIYRSMILAKNRADAQLKRMNLSEKEKQEFNQISKIYGEASYRISEDQKRVSTNMKQYPREPAWIDSYGYIHDVNKKYSIKGKLRKLPGRKVKPVRMSPKSIYADDSGQEWIKANKYWWKFPEEVEY